LLKEIIVLFKTHLDIGFTDLAANVVKSYMTQYIPNAVKTAAVLRERGERFIWTTGSWLIAEYLRQNPDDTLVPDAIATGDIAWHTLPFTSHTELMDAGLFNYALSISKQLDARFGKTTRAAKMTDVPGHTRAIVPYMAKAGVRFLHIGVNGASSAPEVPPLFRWQAPTGEEIIMMYQADYGLFQEIGDSGIALCFAHTGDNNGPQSADDIVALYDKLRAEHPGAIVRAGTLDDVADVAETLTDLPVITSEIGDSWIHGAGCDPLKVSQYRAILRACEQLTPADAEEVYRRLLPVPEHTWGLDEKTTLGQGIPGEHRYFIRTEFEEARKEPKFKRMEISWKEQRGYVQDAMDCLLTKQPVLAEQILSDAAGLNVEVYVRGCAAGTINEPMTIGDYQVTVNEHGAISGLTRSGTVLADANHLWGEVLYQAFCRADFDRYFREYATHDYDWIIEDIGKLGCEAAIAERLNVKPTVANLWYDEDDMVCELHFTGPATELYGAPGRLFLSWRFLPDAIHLDARWYDKAASRVGEAIWLGMHPFGEVATIRKLSEWIDPADTVPKGNRRLHATDYGVRFANGITVETLDTALVTIGEPALLTFPTDAPCMDDGVHFNLFNNVWGTNFVMWYEDNARFRFTIRLN